MSSRPLGPEWVLSRFISPVGDAQDEINELADVVSGLVTIYVTALDAMEGFQIKDDRGPSVEESLEVLQAFLHGVLHRPRLPTGGRSLTRSLGRAR